MRYYFSFRTEALSIKTGLSIVAVTGSSSLRDELPNFGRKKMLGWPLENRVVWVRDQINRILILDEIVCKGRCARHEDFQSCDSTETMCHHWSSSEWIQASKIALLSLNLPIRTHRSK